jgi:hypothetical protein
MVRTTIPVMTPLQHNDLYVGRGASDPARPTCPIGADGHLRLHHVAPLCATRIGFRIEVARAYVIKASRHLRFRPAGVDHYLLPGSGIGRVRCGDELAAPAEGFRVSLIDRQFMDNGATSDDS